MTGVVLLGFVVFFLFLGWFFVFLFFFVWGWGGVGVEGVGAVNLHAMEGLNH